ncbi:hypothetical protein D3C72_105820 [compost metagenome]
MSNSDNPAVKAADPAIPVAEKPRDTLRPDSPCAGYCSTSHGDEICKGCGRTFDEVINWIIYDDAEKAAVWARLEAAGLVKR